MCLLLQLLYKVPSYGNYVHVYIQTNICITILSTIK